VNRFVLLLVSAGVMLCCFWVFLLSLPHSAPHLSSALAGADVEHVERGTNAPTPLGEGSYALTPAEEPQETHSTPVNSYLLTMLLLLACCFGASVLRILLKNARRRGAICSWIGDDRGWLAVAHEDPSLLGVFRL